MTLLDLRVLGTSAKENEHRLPLHPEHLGNLAADLRARITLEEGYGAAFGFSDEALASVVGEIATRHEILEHADVVLPPKPPLSDVTALRPGQVL